VRHLSGQLRAGYQAALRDPELLALREEVALLTGRCLQLLQRLKTCNQEDTQYAALWRELRDTIQEKSRVAQREWQRQASLGLCLTVAEAWTLVQPLMPAVQENVTEPATLSSIQRRFLELLPPPSDN